MKNMAFVKAAAFVLLFAGLVGSASAQITISGGLALSSATLKSADWDDIEQMDTLGLGANVYLDYLLPISIPLSLGLEVGFDTGSTTASDGFEDQISAIPVLLRAAYHFDLMSGLDLYVVGKIGYAFGIWSGDSYDLCVANGYIDGVDYRNYMATVPSGLAFGADVGVAYYFTPTIGIFAEAGFDLYSLASTITGELNESGSWESDKFEVELPFSRFLTLGLSVKF